MKFIKFTSIVDNKPVFINPTTIGHLYEVAEKLIYTRVEKVAHTVVHTVVETTCHNNGGFQVTESIDDILKMIK